MGLGVTYYMFFSVTCHETLHAITYIIATHHLKTERYQKQKILLRTREREKTKQNKIIMIISQTDMKHM